MKGLIALLVLLLFFSACPKADACPPEGCQNVQVYEEGPNMGAANTMYGGVEYNSLTDSDELIVLQMEPSSDDPPHTVVRAVYEGYKTECIQMPRGGEYCWDTLEWSKTIKLYEFGMPEPVQDGQSCEADLMGCTAQCWDPVSCYYCQPPVGEFQTCEEVIFYNFGSCLGAIWPDECGTCSITLDFPCCQDPLDCPWTPPTSGDEHKAFGEVCPSTKCLVHVQFVDGVS